MPLFTRFRSTVFKFSYIERSSCEREKFFLSVVDIRSSIIHLLRESCTNMSQKRPSRLQKRDSNSKREVRTWKELGTRVKQTMWDNWSTWPVVESKCSVSRLDSWNLNAQFVLKIPRLLWMHSEALRFRFNGKRYGELEVPKIFEMNPYSIDVKLYFLKYKFLPTRPNLTLCWLVLGLTGRIQGFRSGL